MGLLADDVLLALTSVPNDTPITVADKRALKALESAREFIDRAADVDLRQRLSRQVDTKAVRSAQAYSQALTALRAGEVDGFPANESSEQEVARAQPLLRRILDALTILAAGQEASVEQRRLVFSFFRALSRIMHEEYVRLKRPSHVGLGLLQGA
jgi:ABC-type amino acid transport substrate-binding protein